VNLTHSYGFKNKIELRCLIFGEDSDLPIHNNDTLLLTGLNVVNKQNILYRLTLNPKPDLKTLKMDSFIYYFPLRYYPNISGLTHPFLPLKAKCSNTYILKRMNVAEFPNLLTTKNFTDFNSITTFSPHKNYNWFTTELIRFKTLNEKQVEGILYKPENFDVKRKYPVIFYYYQRDSDETNFYINVELSRGAINIPWFLSNGYLVCVPDIHYKIGYPGESAYISVTAAAKYLSQQPWVDSSRMGLQGHSYGGFETNYIVTRTNKFAAAVSAAGVSNLTNFYGSFSGTNSRALYFEKGQGRMGVAFVENPSLYINNSPIFSVKNVTTPILIIHNAADITVTWDQGFQWFTGLKRLGRKAWFLQYVGEGHTVLNEKNKLDYSTRVGEFFDFYLKKKDMPEWMKN
jgi:dipeptidyl aminopeptidase/acylaminoacyl peptidase